MSKKTRTRIKPTIHTDALSTVIKATGFGADNMIFEIIDGSKDAGAKNIDIIYKNSDKYDGRKYVRNSDDGHGFNNPCVSVPKDLNVAGAKNKKENVTGAFGIGSSVAVIKNAMDGGESACKSTDKLGRRAGGSWEYNPENPNLPNAYFDNENEQTDLASGTVITLNGLDIDMTAEHLSQLISTTYYPSSQKALGAKDGIAITMDNGKVKKSIEFHDPFFDEFPENENVLEKGESFVQTIYGKYKIRWVQIFPKFLDEHETIFTGDAPFEGSSGKLKSTNSGIYMKRFGRYMSLGNAFFGRDKRGGVRRSGHNLNGVRIELENVDPVEGNEKKLETAEINKSNVSWSALLIKEGFQPLWDEISKVVTELESKYVAYREKMGSLFNKRNSVDNITKAINERLQELPGRFTTGYVPYVKVKYIDEENVNPISFEKNGKTSLDKKRTIIFTINKKSSFYEETTDNLLVEKIVELEVFLRDNDSQLKEVA